MFGCTRASQELLDPWRGAASNASQYIRPTLGKVTWIRELTLLNVVPLPLMAHSEAACGTCYGEGNRQRIYFRSRGLGIRVCGQKSALAPKEGGTPLRQNVTQVAETVILTSNSTIKHTR
jgi:hypothetical protein